MPEQVGPLPRPPESLSLLFGGGSGRRGSDLHASGRAWDFPRNQQRANFDNFPGDSACCGRSRRLHLFAILAPLALAASVFLVLATVGRPENPSTRKSQLQDVVAQVEVNPVGLEADTAVAQAESGTEDPCRSNASGSDPCTPLKRNSTTLAPESTSTTTAGPVLDWIVCYEGPVEVYPWQDLAAAVSYVKWKCTMFKGQQTGEWVRLVGEQGYIPLRKYNVTAVKPIPVYRKIVEGTCADVGMHPVTDEYTCQAAARAMQLKETTAQPIMLVPLPEGCHVFGGRLSSGLYLSTNSLNKGNGARQGRHPICSTYDEPAEPCLPATTTQASTSTSLTWGWPSLFCVTLVAQTELELVKQLVEERGGVFGCDDVAIFSIGEAMELGRWAGKTLVTKSLVPPAGGKLGTDATFMQLWKGILKDGRYQKHDWSVSISPQTVFFPDRLRQHLKAHTPAGGANLFLRNCESATSHGHIEVRSRAAMEAYFWNEEKCKDELLWEGWTEEKFVQECLNYIKTASVYDDGLLSVSSCGPVNCWDKSKVAYRGFDDDDSYLKCWRHSSG